MKIEKFLSEFSLTKEDILQDFMLCCKSREVSKIGRKEVFLGKAKFGIFGDGKELPQAIKARFYRNGDHRAGYYRDQTWVFGTGHTTIQQLFSQLYGHTDIEKEPVSAGRLMTGHFGTPNIDENGDFLDIVNRKNSTTDTSPTASQMPRLIGLAYASKLFRQNKELHQYTSLSNKGNEVAFGSIGNGSTAEGPFLEAVNAAGVLQIPAMFSIWDDEYGISVPNDLQVTKGDIAAMLEGFQRKNGSNGLEIFKVKGWDYMALYEAYSKADELCRVHHIPCLIHVTELTQPSGHSTSGSHERYKSKERLDWEKEHDCNKKFEEWLLAENICDANKIKEIKAEAASIAKEARKTAWVEYYKTITDEVEELNNILDQVEAETENKDRVQRIRENLNQPQALFKTDIFKVGRQVIRAINKESISSRNLLVDWKNRKYKKWHKQYSSMLYVENKNSPLNVPECKPQYSATPEVVDGYRLLQIYFKEIFANDPRIVAFGEDVGLIGDVNQGMAGLQEVYGDLRVTDTGIRECTIIGQAIGMAMRGLRPIAEIQYFDYVLYAIQTMSDDLATVHYRSFGRQVAPVIIRTRGHRLEGVWHSGSYLGGLINNIRGIRVCVPRNMTQAAGLYNTLLKGHDPAIVVECLNAYRLKEDVPNNLSEMTVPLGQPEVLREGTDITIVTYGAMCRIVLLGAQYLEEHDISVEVIDVQTLIPFDEGHMIKESIKKTNRVLFADEDVPGGATAFMMSEVLDKQEAYYYLDAKPKTISSWAHRPAYSTDGDFFSKPNAEDIFDYVYEMMHESNPEKFPTLYED